MKSNYINSILIFLYLVSSIVLLYIFIFETQYGVGVYLWFVIQIFGLTVFGLHYAFTKFNSKRSLMFSAKIIISIQVFYIIIHEIDMYTPTYTITIPTDYEGCVYLFTATELCDDILVNDDGIGYIGSEGKAEWDIMKGDEDITAAFINMHGNEIAYQQENGKTLTVYNVVCFEINDTNQYPAQQDYYGVETCMDEFEFIQMIKLGTIDESRLQRKVWKRSGNQRDWVFDNAKSRIKTSKE